MIGLAHFCSGFLQILYMKNKIILASLLLLTAGSVVFAFMLNDLLLRELSKGTALFFGLLSIKQLSDAPQLKGKSIE